MKYEAGRLVVLDVYDYPAQGRSLESELHTRENEIKSLHSDARLISEGPVTIRPAGRSQHGLKAVFLFSENFRADVPGPYKSQLLLFRRKGDFVKYRATYPREHAPRAEAVIDEFLRKLAWPSA